MVFHRKKSQNEIGQLMTICHIAASIEKSDGGPPRSITHLLSELGTSYEQDQFLLHTYQSKNPIIKKFDAQNVDLRFYHMNLIRKFIGLDADLKDIRPTILHGQGIWDPPIHQMAKIARSMGIPYIITPRGMLEPWSLKQKENKKKVALWIYQMKDLKQAVCLHATANMEAESIRRLGINKPIAIIPNGIPLDDFPEYRQNPKNAKKILFLSRLHKKKGIEFLIEAWSRINPSRKSGWTVEIVGNGSQSYIDHLQNYCLNLGVHESLNISPPLYGPEKLKMYQEASFFVLPTFSENYGVVVAEALACGTPVITTKGAPWEDLIRCNCGLWIDIGTAPLIDALERMLSFTPEKLQEMGNNGRKLIEEKYSMASVANQMHSLYSWIAGKETKPNFVV